MSGIELELMEQRGKEQKDTKFICSDTKFNIKNIVELLEILNRGDVLNLTNDTKEWNVDIVKEEGKPVIQICKLRGKKTPTHDQIASALLSGEGDWSWYSKIEL